jgi:hypothetical protein
MLGKKCDNRATNWQRTTPMFSVARLFATFECDHRRFQHFTRKNGRAGGIRTHDLLNPIQAHYQAVLRPDAEESQDAAPKGHFQAGKAVNPRLDGDAGQ